MRLPRQSVFPVRPRPAGLLPVLAALAATVPWGCSPAPEPAGPAVLPDTPPPELTASGQRGSDMMVVDQPVTPGEDRGDADPAPAADPPEPTGEVVVAQWNSGPLFGVADVAARDDDLRAMAADVNPDVLLLDEVTSLAVAEAVAEALGMPTGPDHVVISDFNPNDEEQFRSLEVAILSRLPLANAVEFDRFPDDLTRPGHPSERRLKRPAVDGVEYVGVSRGFLAADVPALGLTVLNTHLKSSRGDAGPADFENAQKRELVAAAMAEHVADLLAADPTRTVLVGGDLNVGETDANKNGSDPADDESDGYDDTHALLAGGLVKGLTLRSLTKEAGNTYDDTPGDGEFPYPGVGAIDVLYAGGAGADRFEPATLGADTFGSDHYPVRTVLSP